VLCVELGFAPPPLTLSILISWHTSRQGKSVSFRDLAPVRSSWSVSVYHSDLPFRRHGGWQFSVTHATAPALTLSTFTCTRVSPCLQLMGAAFQIYFVMTKYIWNGSCRQRNGYVHPGISGSASRRRRPRVAWARIPHPGGVQFRCHASSLCCPTKSRPHCTRSSRESSTRPMYRSPESRSTSRKAIYDRPESDRALYVDR
jgi:hypothetical protein